MDALDGAGQQRLIDWLDAHAGDAQVVSLATPRLYSLVERERFHQGLYYRLNLVHLPV